MLKLALLTVRQKLANTANYVVCLIAIGTSLTERGNDGTNCPSCFRRFCPECQEQDMTATVSSRGEYNRANCKYTYLFTRTKRLLTTGRAGERATSFVVFT